LTRVRRGAMACHFRAGDPVVYRKQKFSRHPGRNAASIFPAANGDDYCYSVEKFWRVVAVAPDGKLEICTRRGKRHTVAADDPALRPASWWERLRYRRRFPPPVPGQ
jgi:hypothetical protein